MDRIELLVLVIRLDREERTYMDIYIFTTKIIFTGRLAETLKIQARNSIEAMQAYDYIRSKTTQKEKLFHPVSRNKNSFSEEEQKKKKERKTIPKFRYVRNKNRRKKRDKEKERERKIMLIVNKYLISFAATGQV